MLSESPADAPCFTQAAQEWDLDRLYGDIKNYTLETLTDRNKTILQGLLCDYPPREIARIAYGKNTSETISKNLTEIYEIIRSLNEHESGDHTKIAYHNIRRTLKSLGYHKSSQDNQM